MKEELSSQNFISNYKSPQETNVVVSPDLGFIVIYISVQRKTSAALSVLKPLMHVFFKSMDNFEHVLALSRFSFL